MRKLNTMSKFNYLIYILLSFSLLALASCGDDDVKSFDSSKLEGTWSKVRNVQVMDVDVVYYTFYPENWYSGRIEEYVSNWPDEGWKITDLNYRVGETGHMIIYTGKVHDGQSKLYGEYDVQIKKSEMIWYKTDTKEEVARFKKEINKPIIE